jgi:hypothetical protein
VAKTLKTFAKSMRQRAQQLPHVINDSAVDASAAMLKELIAVTPVDTSEAISNWQVTLGAPTASPRLPHFTGVKGSTRNASSKKAIAEGLSELAQKQPGQPLFVSNSAKHIVDLDNGSSAQFPGGFVPIGLITFRVALKDALRRLFR